ncbi:MAG: dTMP kinase [archaeon]
MPGKLIVFEGIDGCGKSTHAELLTEFLKEHGKEVLHTAEPSHGQIGKLLREYLRQDAPPLVDTMLFIADRAEHVEQEIKPALEQGKTVICERYTYSTIAYQAAQGLDMEWLKSLNSFAPKPDIVILLDVPPEVGAGRTTTEEKFENTEFLTKVRGNYLKLAEESGFKIIDASREVDLVQDEIRNLV